MAAEPADDETISMVRTMLSLAVSIDPAVVADEVLDRGLAALVGQLKEALDPRLSRGEVVDHLLVVSAQVDRLVARLS